MTINEIYLDVFKNVEIGKILTRREIITMIQEKHDIDEGSILPSDVCYNSSNAGVRRNTNPFNKNYFLKIKRGVYKFVGPDFDDKSVNPYEFGTSDVK